MIFIEKKIWWNYLEHDLQELLKQSLVLHDFFKNNQQYHDYSFIVFSAAKAYEGFLKKMFLDLKFINEKEYFGKRIRIGRALNPYYKKGGSIYSKLINYCNGKKLANELWDTWKTCRNQVFHWFPNETKAVDHDEASVKINKIINAIDMSFSECKLDQSQSG